MKSEGFIPYDQQGRMYARAALGLSVMRWQDEVGVHIKPFEIMASGAACLAERRAGMEALWTEGKEIAMFDSPAEARQKAAALLADPAGLRDLTAAGRARTLRDHTWGKRVGTIVELVRRLRAE